MRASYLFLVYLCYCVVAEKYVKREICSGQFECANGTCIAVSKKCNGDDDCGDLSDEQGCPCKPKFEWQCPDKKCILKEWMCDGYKDCTDGADEDPGMCSICYDDEFTCKSYECILKSERCDGVAQCSDDEVGCIRLGDNIHSRSGELTGLHQGKYIPICADNWTNELGNLVCKQLGYGPSSSSTFASRTSSTYYKVDTNKITGNISYLQSILNIGSCQSTQSVNIVCQNKDCGKRAPYVSYIIGGNIVPEKKHPWTVALFHLNKFLCGAAIIDNQWLVTATHCVNDKIKTPQDVKVMAGSVNIRQPGTHAVYFKVKKIIPYPGYFENPTPVHDISLILLDSSIQYNQYIQPLCIPDAGAEIKRTTLCYLSGWGMTSRYVPTPVSELRDAKMKIRSTNQCKLYFTQHIPDYNEVVCAGYSHNFISACSGDSGSPLACRGQNQNYYLGGIASFGAECSEILFGISGPIDVYSKTSFFTDWIYKTMHAQNV